MACAPMTNDQQLQSIPVSQISETPAKAIKNSAVITITPGDTLASELQKTDPVILLGGKKKYRSNYKLFQFEAKENEIYLIELASCSDDSIILFPQLGITDNNGNMLQHNKIVQYGTFPQADRSVPCIYCLQEIYTAETGMYYIFVVSDNSFVKGTAVTTLFWEPVFTFKLKSISGIRSPWGDFRLCVRKK